MVSGAISPNNIPHWRFETRVCECCQSVYIPSVSWQKYCHRDCRNAKWYETNRERKVVYMQDYRARLCAERETHRIERAATNLEITKLHDEISELKQLILGLQSAPVRVYTEPQRKLAEPSAMDIELEIKKDENAGKKSVDNFINSMLALNPTAAKQTPPVRELAGNPKAMDVPQFDAPSFEDMDLGI